MTPGWMAHPLERRLLGRLNNGVYKSPKRGLALRWTGAHHQSDHDGHDDHDDYDYDDFDDDDEDDYDVDDDDYADDKPVGE